MANTEYNYIYEDGRITRAAQCTITMSGDNVTSKTLDFAIHYVYDKDGKLTLKYNSDDTIITGGNYYEYDKNEGTVVLRREDGKTIIAHSKTDSFGRKEFDELQLSTGYVSRKFSYLAGEKNDVHVENGKVRSTPTTNLVSEIVMSDGHVLSYEYDAEERITKVVDTDTIANTSTVTEYTYDALGQLLTEVRDGVTVNTMSYDNYGNITAKNGITYTYDTTWKDLLIAYNGQSITYDAQGNPTSYLGHTLTWEKGRQLKSYDTNTYTYNANGIRTSKTIGGVKHTYILDGAKVLYEKWGENVLSTLWDNEDSLCGIRYADESYFFLKNLQGDIIAITDKDGAVVARYSYDAWGVPTIVSDTSTVGIATINPFRYRGYYYDAEIGMYYLQSRYYNPTLGRFVNVDEALYVQLGNNPNEFSLYEYCINCPINTSDSAGYLPKWILNIKNSLKGILSALGFDIVLNVPIINGVLSDTVSLIRAISNYNINSKLERQHPITGFIDYQSDYSSWWLGWERLSNCGCELISVYNVMKALGKPCSLSELALLFELSGYVMLYGILGSAPTKLWQYFDLNGIKYNMTYNFNTLSKVVKSSKCVIVSCWNDPIDTGLHTFMVRYENGLYRAYNGYNRGKERQGRSLDEILYADRFIVGYWFK